MNSNMALVLVVVLILGTVIFLRVRDSADRFEDNESRKEYMKLFLEGFNQGVNNENVNNRVFVDDILKRLGYTQVEQIEAIKQAQETPLPEETVPEYIPPHEEAFLLEQISRQDGKDVEAQWADQNLLEGLPMNTPEQ